MLRTTIVPSSCGADVIKVGFLELFIRIMEKFL